LSLLRRLSPVLIVAGLGLSAPSVWALSSADIIKQGIEALKQGNAKEAYELFGKAQRLDNRSPKPHYYIAAALERLSYPDSAAVEYQTALQMNPKYVEALTGLGNLLRKQGKLPEGTAKLEEAVKYGPKDAPAVYSLGQAYLKDKRYDEALTVFRRGTLLKQWRELFLDGMGLALEGKGDLKQAEEILIRARETNPNSLRVRLDLGGFYQRKKIPVLAAPEFGKAAELDPKNAETHFLYGKALVGMNEFNAGLAAYMKAIEVDSTYAPAYLESGRLFYRANRPTDAAERFRAYSSLKPDDPEAYLDLGRALAKSRDPNDRREAVVALERANELKPNDAGVLSQLCKLYYELPDEKENAIKYCDLYASLADTLLTPEENLRVGTLYVSQGDSTQAVEHLTRALAADSTLRKEASFQLGFMFFARKDFASAIPYFEQTLKVDSTSLSALLNLGLCRSAVQDRAGALEVWRRAIAVNPKEVRAMVWVAQTLVTLDSLPDATEMYQRAIAADSANTDALRGAGLTLLLQNDCGASLGYLKQAAELQPDHVQGHIWLAQARSKCQDPMGAKEEFNKAIDLDPTNREASRGLEIIRKWEQQQAARSSGAKN
jgi:tetratricopeptide (TPR) repeat protein